MNPEWVADVEAGARRVGEHVEHEQLLAAGGGELGVAERTGRVRRLERVLGVPPLLPPHLDLLGELGGVACGGVSAAFGGLVVDVGCL